MSRILIRRILWIPVVLLAVTVVMQTLYLFLPGDPAVALAGGANASPSDIRRIREELNLNDPVYVAYWDWLRGAVQLDLGTSLLTGVPVIEEIARRFPITASLGIASLVFAVPVGIVLGVVAAVWQNSWVDRVVLVMSSMGIAVPAFIVGLVLVVVFGINLGWLPAIGYVPFASNPIGWLQSIAMPAVALGATPAARIARTLRGSLVRVLDGEFVRTAWSKGTPTKYVLVKHALRNSLIPTVTVIGLQLDVVVGGSVVVESVFSIPGLGSYIARAATGADLPAIQAIVVAFALATVLANLLVDLAYIVLNPKVRVS